MKLSMMKKISKNSFIILLCSFVISQDYSLINIYWEPEFPSKGDDITIYADVSNSEFFKYSYQMNIHLTLDLKKYFTHAMSRDYSKGLFIWTYKYNLNQDIHFQIDNNDGFNDISSNLIEISDIDPFLLVKESLLSKDYTTAMLSLNEIVSSYKGSEIAAKAKYMEAEIYLNDFKEFEIAASSYSEIINNYPPHYNVVKKSIFTLAYVYANHLDYYSDAINMYNKFKELYPNDDLIMSIDYELDLLEESKSTIDLLLNTPK